MWNFYRRGVVCPQMGTLCDVGEHKGLVGAVNDGEATALAQVFDGSDAGLFVTRGHAHVEKLQSFCRAIFVERLFGTPYQQTLFGCRCLLVGPHKSAGNAVDAWADVFDVNGNLVRFRQDDRGIAFRVADADVIAGDERLSGCIVRDAEGLLREPFNKRINGQAFHLSAAAVARRQFALENGLQKGG